VALVTAGVEYDVLGFGFDEISPEDRSAVLAAYPRIDFEESIIRAFADGFMAKPDTPFGTVDADVLADRLPGYERGSVALAWMPVHTVFLLRYARLFCTAPMGGIDFGGEAPDYRDFADLALTIGMTFQVSDTDLTGKRVRRVALHYALLSYVFGTGIVAITVSSVAALAGR